MSIINYYRNVKVELCMLCVFVNLLNVRVIIGSFFFWFKIVKSNIFDGI